MDKNNSDTNPAENHKSGFVNIIGNPNVGKSTLMNAMIGDKLSIITSKPQTTRHRILGIISEDEYQVVFSDTPGIIEQPHYGMHESMNKFAFSSFSDADLLLLVIDKYEEYDGDEKVIESLKKTNIPKFLVINKTDLAEPREIGDLVNEWKEICNFDEVHTISALNKEGTDRLLSKIVERLPINPPYYPKDQMSDRSERFFVSEIIREKILKIYKQEIPYSCEVIVDQFIDEERNGEPFSTIYASIYVDRKSQKPILIGRGGSQIKKLGIAARQDIENFLDRHIYLELKVKIKDGWRDDDRVLKHFGY